MRDLIEAVQGSNLPTDIEAALDAIDKAEDALFDAVEATTHKMVAEMSLQWPDSIVAAFTGHGMSHVEISPSPELVAQCEGDSEEADENWQNLMDRMDEFCDERKNPLMVLYANVETAHRNSIPDYGLIAYRDGQAVTQQDYYAAREQLPGHFRRGF